MSFGVVMLLSPFCYSSSHQFLSSWIYPQKAQAQALLALQWTVWARRVRKLQFLLCSPHQSILLQVLCLATCGHQSLHTAPSDDLASQLLLKSALQNFLFFHWASLHFPGGNTALCAYHSLNKLWHPRKIKMHNRFEAAWDSQWWKWWNNSSFPHFVQPFHGKETCDTTTRERHGTPDKFPATFHG